MTGPVTRIAIMALYTDHRQSKRTIYKVYCHADTAYKFRSGGGTLGNLFMLVGGNIRQLRKKRQFTLEVLAEKSDLHPKYLGGVERGEQNISIENLDKIAIALQVKPYELMIPTAPEEMTDELIALIRVADTPTQNFLLDLLKRIPQWKQEVLSRRRKRG